MTNQSTESINGDTSFLLYRSRLSAEYAKLDGATSIQSIRFNIVTLEFQAKLKNVSSQHLVKYIGDENLN